MAVATKFIVHLGSGITVKKYTQVRDTEINEIAGRRCPLVLGGHCYLRYDEN
jgi:hypothetical protein